MDIVDKLQGFPRLKKVRVCIGTNGMGGSGSAGRRDNSEAWTKCMRYAEIGASVDKFLFLAAKSGSADVFYSSIGGGGGEMVEGALRGGMPGGPWEGGSGQHRAGTSRQGEASFLNGFDAVEGGCGEDMRGVHGIARLERGREEEGGEGAGEGESEEIESERGQQQQQQHEEEEEEGGRGQFGFSFPHTYMARDAASAAAASAASVDLTLKQVMGPSDDSLKRMMPVIIFAIIRGFDEFRDVIPCLLLKLPLLQQLLLVDVTDNVTIHMRPHHMAQLRRANRRTFGGSLGLESLGSEGLGPESLAMESMVLGEGSSGNAEGLVGSGRAEEGSPTDMVSEMDGGMDGSMGGSTGGGMIGGMGSGMGIDGAGSSGIGMGVGVGRGSTRACMGPSDAFGDEEFRPELLGAGMDAGMDAGMGIDGAGSSHVGMGAASEAFGDEEFRPELLGAGTADQTPVLETAAPAELSRRDLSCHPDSPNFHVSFWRTDRVRVAYPLPRQHQELTDVSVCVATQDSVALDDADVAELARSAVGGPVLAATVAFLNSQSSMHAL
ncbi:unnamed protein product [Closterium sp. NIES-64]|nr:unnamed protein product [Closterium sp. NIES-64]